MDFNKTPPPLILKSHLLRFAEILNSHNLIWDQDGAKYEYFKKPFASCAFWAHQILLRKQA